jgi:hypothetical protein
MSQAVAAVAIPVSSLTTTPIAEKPKLTLVPPPAPVVAQAPVTEPLSETARLIQRFRAQNRECWVCHKLAGDFDKGKKISEDDTYHLNVCVESWDHINGTLATA